MSRKKTDDSGIKLWLVLWKATNAVKESAFVSITHLNMCISDFAVMELLLNKGPSRVNEIGKKVFLTSGSITAALDRLEKRGYVKRENEPDDRRVKQIILTVKGRKLIRSSFSEHKLAMEEAVSSLSAPERRTLIKLLKKLGKGIKENEKRPANTK